MAKLRNDEIIRLRHREYEEHVDRWRWLLDSLEGGERYRHARYGGRAGVFSRRNLIRHKHEVPAPRRGLPEAGEGYEYPLGPIAGLSLADGILVGPGYEDRDYLLRLERTPIPSYVAEAIDSHLSEIYTKEIDREFPDPGLAVWQLDVDGTGTSLDEWMADTVAPILLALGQLDIYVDRPSIPPDMEVNTRADVERLGLDRVVASIVLPENIPWWKLDPVTGRYVECVVIEYQETDDGKCLKTYRHWTATDSTLYDPDGGVITETPHGYGRVPIERVFDRRKVRCRNIGQSRYEGIAERQKEVYNLESELILTNTTQAHPIVQGPEDYVAAGGEIPTGPGHILPKKLHQSGTGVSYEGWEVVDFPKGPAESIREDIQRHRDAVDRAAKMTKPPGATGTTGNVVAQSGISKALDQKGGNALLSKLSKVLAGAERCAAELVLTVIHGGDKARIKAELDRVVITYPTSFNLLTADEVATIAAEFQGIMAAAGEAPETETRLLQSLVRDGLPGLEDDDYQLLDDEIATAVQAKATRKDQMRESLPIPGTIGPSSRPAPSTSGDATSVYGPSNGNPVGPLNSS